MSNLILIDGDTVIFDPMFGAAIVTVKPGKMKGTGKTSLNSKAVCVEGDEAKVEVAGCDYMAPPYVSPTGKGTLTISSLGGDQKAQKTQSGGKAVLLHGGKFNAEFAVQIPAQQPGAPPVPDPMKKYMGTGAFKTSNNKYKAT